MAAPPPRVPTMAVMTVKIPNNESLKVLFKLNIYWAALGPQKDRTPTNPIYIK